MKYVIRLSDVSAQHLVLVTLPEEELAKSAVDVLFDVVGADDTQALVAEGIINEGQIEDLRAIKAMVFDRDAQGLFVREGVDILTNGKSLNPDNPIVQSFVSAELEGMKYWRCDLTVSGSGGASPSSQSNLSQDDQVELFGRLFFVHQIAVGAPIDVTTDYPEIQTVIAWAEKEGLIEVDVQKASYKLTEQGKTYHDRVIQEAQDLVKRYDVYGDVDLDPTGSPHFDTGFGRDLRIPLFELNGVDPFRARFLIGLNDGEWDNMSNWIEVCLNKTWYAKLFESVETAPSIEQIGRDTMLRIFEEGRTISRRDVQK